MINETEVTFYTIEDKIFNHDKLYEVNENTNTFIIKYPFKDFNFHLELSNVKSQNNYSITKMNPRCLSCVLTSHFNIVTNFIMKSFLSPTRPIPDPLTNYHLINFNKEELLKDLLSTYLPIESNPVCKPCSFKSTQIIANPKSQQFYPCKSAYVKRVNVCAHLYDSYITAIDITATEIPSLGLTNIIPNKTYYMGVGSRVSNKSSYRRTNHSWVTLFNPISQLHTFSDIDLPKVFNHYNEWKINPTVEKYLDKLPGDFPIYHCTECGQISIGKTNSPFLSWIPSVRLNAIDNLENKVLSNIKNNITNPKVLHFLGE